MPSENFTDRAGRAYSAARENPYLQRLIEDDELRASLISAFTSARKAYDRFSADPSFDTATGDRRMRRELGNAADALRDATARLQAPPKKSHTVRNLIALALISGGLVLVFSEGARKALLDAIFGQEEEFVYTSTTAAPSAAQTNGTPVSDSQPADQ